jgi:hypothetical protein
MEDNTRYLHNLVVDRSAFFANRVDTYAKAHGLSNQDVIDHLCQLAATKGRDEITGIIDKYMPPHLHSSQMPV